MSVTAQIMILLLNIFYFATAQFVTAHLIFSDQVITTQKKLSTPGFSILHI
jgi:hypothetical protein